MKQSCQDCWFSKGTQRQTQLLTIGRKRQAVVSRLCRKSGLFVGITHNVASCNQWTPCPSVVQIAKKANADAIDRVHPELSEESK